MTKELKETLRASIVPVIIGNGAPSCRVAWRLYLSFGALSLRLGAHRRLSDLLGLPCLFRKASTDDRLLCEQLLDIAEEFDGYLLLLIPSDKPSWEHIERHREALASRYLLSSPDEVFSHIPCLHENERQNLL